MSRRVIFWIAFLTLAAVFTAWTLNAQKQRSARALEQGEQLRQMLAGRGERYSRVRVSVSSHPAAWVRGEFETEVDRAAFKREVAARFGDAEAERIMRTAQVVPSQP